jgi:hypothetical protein
LIRRGRETSSGRRGGICSFVCKSASFCMATTTQGECITSSRVCQKGCTSAGLACDAHEAGPTGLPLGQNDAILAGSLETTGGCRNDAGINRECRGYA